MSEFEPFDLPEQPPLTMTTEPSKRRLKRGSMLRLGLALLVGVLFVRSMTLQSRIDEIALQMDVAALSMYEEPVDLEAFIGEISKSIVDITCGANGGTGFAYFLTGLDVGYKTFVVTNHHVIEECTKDESTLAVTYGGDKLLPTESKLFNFDADNDLAVLQIKAKLPTLSDATEYAESGWWTMAIGNPGTYDGSLYNATTFGHIVGVEDKYWNYTSAVVNPGNSGGPLVDSQGRLIGVNTLHTVDSKRGIWNTAVDAIVLCEEIVECDE